MSIHTRGKLLAIGVGLYVLASLFFRGNALVARYALVLLGFYYLFTSLLMYLTNRAWLRSLSKQALALELVCDFLVALAVGYRLLS